MEKQFAIICFILASVRMNGAEVTTYTTIDGIEWECGFPGNYEVVVSPAHPEELSGPLSFPKTVPDTSGNDCQVTSVYILWTPGGSYNSRWISKYPNITSIYIPDGVTSIREAAFMGCTGVTSIRLPDSLQSIGHKAFCSCSSLREISIPDCVTSIGNGAFEHCYGLNRVHIGKGLKKLQKRTFWYCSALTTLTFGEPSNLAEIEEQTFAGTSLQNISFPDLAPRIHSAFDVHENAFSWYTGFTQHETPNDYAEGWPPLHETQVQSLEFGNIFDEETHLPRRGYYMDAKDFWGNPITCNGYCPSMVDGSNYTCLDENHYGASPDRPRQGTGALGVAWFSYWKGYGPLPANRLTEDPLLRSVQFRQTEIYVPCEDVDTTQTFRTLLERNRSYERQEDGGTLCYYDGLVLDAVVHWYWNWPLTIHSPYGSPNPECGMIAPRSYRDTICSVEPYVPNETDPRIRYECTGWKGTGSVPATGSGTNLVVQVKEDSTLEWQWATNFLIECSISGEATARTVSVWQRKGEPLVLPVETDVASPSAVFSGDAEGVVFDEETRTITIPSDRPRAFLARIDSGSKLFSAKVLQLFAGGDSEWSLVAESSASDGYALRSGSISQGETSTVEMRVEEGGVLAFDWKVSANRSDWAYFYVDGVLAASITRETDWANISTNLADGSHVLRWVFDRHAATFANDEAAFLDNVSWHPFLSLAVASAYGTPSPVAGTSLVSYGDVVSASVVAPAPANGTRHVCTGWTGTGSVPAQGTTESFPFVMTKPSSLTWQWRTDRWIDLSVVSGGNTSFQPQWIENGKTVSVSIVPDTHLFRISLSGDTQGVTVSGTRITFTADRPRTIRVTVDEVKLPLSVESAHGLSIPQPGVYDYSWGGLVWCEAIEPVPEAGVQYRCAGWRGTGSAPLIGYDRQFQFRIEEPSSVFWQWQTNVYISLETEGAIAVDIAEKWVERGTSLVVPFAPLADYVAFDVGGDADGVVIDEQTRTITIPADRPRSVSVTATTMSLASALDTRGLDWTTSGGDVWVPQRAVSFDCLDAAASGDATGGDSLLETSVLGAGTLSWFWKMNASGWAGVDASVDGRDVAYLETSGDWTSASTQIAGDGPHSVRFAFWTEEGCTSSDRAYLDRVSWTGATIPRATQTTPEAVPYSWLDRWPDLLAENGCDYERAAFAIAANGINSVWECYVAGLDPTVPSSVFRVDISMDGNDPRIDWTPDLGVARDYRLEGRTKFGDSDGWKSPVTDDHRFFRARVALPNDSGSVEDNPYPGFVTVTFDANGGTVEPECLFCNGLGKLGSLPVPTHADLLFSGWYSSPVGGIPFTEESPVPWNDYTLFAHWGSVIIHFDANGGYGRMSDWIGSLIGGGILPQNKFKRDGYHFAGWSLLPDGEFFVNDCAIVSGLTTADGAEKTLYAVWQPNHYVIRFNSNGGSGRMSDMDAVYDFQTALPANTFVRDGFAFAGWTREGDGKVEFQDKGSVNNLLSDSGAIVTLNAQWLESQSGSLKVRISFAANGGEGNQSDLLANPGSLVTIPSSSFTRANYTFSGWATSSNGPVVYLPGERTAFDACSTLYAVWSRDCFTVRFSCNGGTGTMEEVRIPTHLPTELPTNRFCRTGFTFVGWATSSRGDAAYADGAIVSDLASSGRTITLYAVWTDRPTYLVVDLSDGSRPDAVYPVSGLMSPPKNGWTDEFKTTKLVLRRIDSGAFIMGSSDDELGHQDNETLHTVGISSHSYIGVFEVTQKQWELVMGENPSSCKGDMRPVETISFAQMRGVSAGASTTHEVDAQSFIGRIRSRSGMSSFDLPTEAVWEYACRAGTETALNNGANLTNDEQDSTLDRLGRYSKNLNDGKGGYSQHTTVGSYEPNAWGLYDMHGNVWECCLDWFGELSTETVFDPIGPETGTQHVAKGGSWKFDAADCRSARRIALDLDSQYYSFGMRLAISGNASDYSQFRTIRFFANGAGGTMSPLLVNANQTVTLPPISFVRDGYTFEGWATNSNGTVCFANGETISALGSLSSSEVALYAVWRANRYSIRYHDGESIQSVEATVDCAVDLVLPTKHSSYSWQPQGFNGGNLSTFDGWSLSNGGPIAYYGGQSAVNLSLIDGDIVELYANYLPYGFRYEIENEAVIIRQLNNTDIPVVSIPASINGTPVRKLDTNSFAGHTELTNVVVPDSVQMIEECVFQNCSSLASVSLGNGLIDLRTQAFNGCSTSLFDRATISGVSLVDGWVVQAASAPHIVSGALNLQGIRGFSWTSFDWCAGLTSVTIGEGPTTIPYGAFSYCRNLKSVSIPNSVKSIGRNAFDNCTNLLALAIPDSVTNIESSAFSGCSAITSLTIGSGLTKIDNLPTPSREYIVSDDSPFASTRNGILFDKTVSELIRCPTKMSGSVVIPESVTRIANHAFDECSELSSITIPYGVMSIGDCAFSNCSGLNSLTIPGSITSIGLNAFYHCSGLKSVSIPDGVTTIEDQTFLGCSELTSVMIPNSVTSIGRSAFNQCSKLTNITIPNNVTTIGGWTFYSCSRLTSLTIPDAVTSIGDHAFQNSGLTSLSLPQRFEGNTTNMDIPDGCTVTFRD